MAPLAAVAPAIAAMASAATTAAPAITALTTMAGAGISAMGTIAAGKAQKSNATYQAKQLKQKGLNEQAAAFQDAEEFRKKKELTLSRQQALAAASGFMADDPSNLDIAEDIEARGTLQSRLAMFGGESRRAGLDAEAAGTFAQGDAALTGSYFNAAGTILGGIGSGMSQYAKLKPSYG